MTVTHSEVIDTTLVGGIAWVQRNLQRVALDKAAQMYGRGSFGNKPTVIVDGRKDKPIKDVKPFGSIVFVPSMGPIKEAAEMAWGIVQGAAPVLTSHYKSSFVWYVNGKPASTGGVPDLKRIGAKGNVELADLAPYATMAEIQVPRGVLYAAYLAIKRTYGNRLAVRFGYRKTVGAYTQNEDGQATRNRPLYVPFLEIGNKASNVRTTATKPGTFSRKKDAPRKWNRRGGRTPKGGHRSPHGGKGHK